MDIKDIKIGETYNVRVQALKIEAGKHVITKTLDSDGCINTVCTTTFLEQDLSAFSPITPAPKYDPCRKFRKGDIVEVKEDIDGRKLHVFTTGLTLGKLYTVEEDEKDCKLKIKNDDGCGIYAFVHFKLVTPVEKMEPYFVGESENSYDLFRKTSNGNQLRASFWWKHNPTPDLIELSIANAKAAAEAERDRLNAEYRKEQQ